MLLLPAGEFAALRRGVPGITKETALSGTRVPDGGFAALFASAPVVTVTRSSTLEQVSGCQPSLGQVRGCDGRDAAPLQQATQVSLHVMLAC